MPTDAEIDFILENAHDYLDRPPTREDILSVFSGVRPLVRASGDESTSSLSRDHTIAVSKSGLVTTRQYDALCRLTRMDDSSGYFEIHSYYNAGSPTTQYVQVQTPAADASGNLWKRQYIDGLGRVYKTVVKGPTVNQDITEETTYTNRNQIAAKTLPTLLSRCAIIPALAARGVAQGPTWESPPKGVSSNLPRNGRIDSAGGSSGRGPRRSPSRSPSRRGAAASGSSGR